MSLRDAEPGKKYIISDITVNDDELRAFLFTLGCYSGESIRLISRRSSGCIVIIKNGRYSIDKNLAAAIKV